MKRIVLGLLLISLNLFGSDESVCNQETEDAMSGWLNGVWSFKPHHTNYLLPFSYRNGGYKAEDPAANQYKEVEAEIQVSFKLPLGGDYFGLGEKYYLAYTHMAKFQVYAHSSPFRETNYNPEAFVVFPVTGNTYNLDSVTLAIAHLSNGEHEESSYTYVSQDPNNLSRSINYLYSEFRFKHDSLITDFKVMLPLPESKKTNDNPDIMKYIGYSSLKFTYFLNKHMFTLMGRTNLVHGHGAIEGTYSYPIGKGTYFYGKIFSGYADSLIDYNNRVARFSLGFSFSR